MKNYIFDTHCHYNLEPLFSGKEQFFSKKHMDQCIGLGWKDHWQKAQKNGVLASLIAGTDLQSSQLAIDISRQHPHLFASIGLNPVDFHSHNRDSLLKDLEEIQDLAKNEKVVAIGETGLDYFRFTDQSNGSLLIDLQQEIFVKHIQLANQFQKPLIIHARDKHDTAYLSIIDLLKTHYQFIKPFVLHCVSGPLDYIETALELGGYISFAGNITYPNAQNLREILSIVPFDRLLIETDAPFLPPQSYRGEVNQPAYICNTASYLQENFEVNLAQVLVNSQNFFDVHIQAESYNQSKDGLK